MIREATITITELLESSSRDGQDTLYTNSVYESLRYAVIFFI